jgi:hypothetical protein
MRTENDHMILGIKWRDADKGLPKWATWMTWFCIKSDALPALKPNGASIAWKTIAAAVG